MFYICIFENIAIIIDICEINNNESTSMENPILEIRYSSVENDVDNEVFNKRFSIIRMIIKSEL